MSKGRIQDKKATRSHSFLKEHMFLIVVTKPSNDYIHHRVPFRYGTGLMRSQERMHVLEVLHYFAFKLY